MQLLKGLLKHDNRVLSFIYKEYRQMVRLLIYRLGRTSSYAKNIFQDGILDMLQMVEKPKLKCSIKTMIYSIYRNLWSKRVGKLRMEIPLVVSDQETPAEAAFPDHQEIQLYERLFWITFNDLPETCKKVLLLHWKHYNHKEISNFLNLNESYVKNRKSLCTNRFVDMVKQHKDYGLLSKSCAELKTEKSIK